MCVAESWEDDSNVDGTKALCICILCICEVRGFHSSTTHTGLRGHQGHLSPYWQWRSSPLHQLGSIFSVIRVYIAGSSIKGDPRSRLLNVTIRIYDTK